MTTLKVNVIRRPQIKVKALVNFPANVVTQNFLTVTNSGGTYTFSIDYTRLGPGPVIDPTTAFVAVLDTTSGTYKEVTLASLLTSGLDADLQAIAALAGAGILVKTAANTWAFRTVTAGASIGITNGDGVAGNPTIAVTDPELVAIAGLTSAADQLPYFTGSGTASLATLTTFARTLIDDTTQGAMQTTLGLVPGTNVQAFDSDLAALAANAGTGLWAVTGVGTGSVRTLTAPAAGITVSNGGGVAGNPTLVLANDLSALEALASTGIARRTGTDAWSVGTAVALSEMATQAAWSFVVNNTSGSAAPTAVDIPSFTLKGSPAGTDLIVISDQAASGALKRATITSIASAGSVSSVNGQTGTLTLPVLPQGRLTLQTLTPVMSSTQSAKTTIYYTAYQGNQVPIYDGTNMISTPITGGEISVATTDTAKNPAAIGASKVNDWFIWNDAGTIRISHGPDWTSDIARSAGTALVTVNGILLNNASITNGPAASRGTYVGTTRSNASSQLDWIIPAGLVAGAFNVWNAYNRKLVSGSATDNGTWTYTTGTVRQTHGAATNQINFVSGLLEDSLEVSFGQVISLTANAGSYAEIGWGLDSITVRTKSAAVQNTGTGAGQFTAFCRGSLAPQAGAHYVASMELGDGTHANTFFGAEYSALTLTGMF